MDLILWMRSLINWQWHSEGQVGHSSLCAHAVELLFFQLMPDMVLFPLVPSWQHVEEETCPLEYMTLY